MNKSQLSFHLQKTNKNNSNNNKNSVASFVAHAAYETYHLKQMLSWCKVAVADQRPGEDLQDLHGKERAARLHVQAAACWRSAKPS